MLALLPHDSCPAVLHPTEGWSGPGQGGGGVGQGTGRDRMPRGHCLGSTVSSEWTSLTRHGHRACSVSAGNTFQLPINLYFLKGLLLARHLLT